MTDDDPIDALRAACESLGLPPETADRAAFVEAALRKPRSPTCKHGHDMLDPANVRVRVASDRQASRGWRIWYHCRACQVIRNDDYTANERQYAVRYCQQCKAQLFRRGHSRFCSTSCRLAFQAEAGRKASLRRAVDPTPAQVDRMLELHAELERETRAWLRADIQRQLDELRADLGIASPTLPSKKTV